jgi:predicted dehydrogenase
LKAVYSRSKATATKLLTEAEKLGFAPGSIDLYSDETDKGLNDLLKRSDISGVIIVLPIPLQPEIVRKSLAAGKHVLFEKPIAKDVKTAKELIHDYQTQYAPKGLILSVAEQFRYMDANDLARKWVVDDKLIGDLTQVHLRVWRDMQPGGKYYETEWRKKPEYQGGFILDGGVHHVALLRYVSGQEIVETRSFARQIAPHLPPTDTVNAALLFSGGAIGTFSMSFASTKSDTEFNFIGTKGSLSMEIDRPDGWQLTLTDTGKKVVKQATIKSNGVDAEIAAFLKAIAAGKNEDKAGTIEALNDVAVVESLVSEGGRVQIWQS